MTEIIQQIPVVRKETKPYATPDERWEEVTTEIYGSAELPTTTHYEHDPLWDKRFWAIQNIRDQVDIGTDRFHFGFWSFVGGLFLFCNAFWFFRGFTF